MSVKPKSTNREYLYAIIFFAIVALGWIIPPVLQLTEVGMRLVFLFIAAIFGWSVTMKIWPSFFLFVLLPFVGLFPLSSYLQMTIGSEVWIFLVITFVILAFMEQTNVSSYICYWLLSRKFTIGHPYRIVFMFLFTSWFLTVFSSTIFVGVFMVWGVFYAFAKKLNYTPYETFSNIMVFMIAMAGVMGCHTVPWAPPCLTIGAAYTQLTGLEVNMSEYLLYTIPFSLISLFALLFLCKIFKLDVSRMKEAALSAEFFSEEEKTLTKEKKMALITMVIFILMLLIPSFIPKGTAVRTFLDSMGMTNKALLLFGILSLIEINGKQVFDFAKTASQGVNWNVIMMVASINGLGSSLGNSATGINETLTAMFGSIAGMNKVAFISILMILYVILTNFFTNAIVAIVLLLPAISAGASYGVSPEQAYYMLTLTCAFAILTPGAGAGAVILFSNREWVQTKTIWKYGFLTLIVVTILAVIYTIALW